MLAATIPTLAAAAILTGGAVIGTSVSGPADPALAPGASETQSQDAGASNHDHADMAQMHEKMMAEHPEMAQMHERMMAEHPDMARMHQQMMGGMGAGMMGGGSGMSSQ